MAIRFCELTAPPLAGFTAEAPSGAVIGITGENGAGTSRLLRVAAGMEAPASGSVEAPRSRRLLAAGDALDLAGADLLLLDHALALRDLPSRERAAIAIDRARRAGATVLLVSHEEELLRRLADEVWWLEAGLLAGRGDPGEVLRAYRSRAAVRLREWGETAAAPLDPRLRRGDGRAEITALETIGENGRPTLVLRSGELAVVRLAVRFHGDVADPVLGIMIRTRIGLNVYGTNTELEGLKLGPRRAGEGLAVAFAFRAALCPGEYTVTAASHDPDGVWHDWLEDAAGFSVADDRYTAGVANLRATVRIAD